MKYILASLIIMLVYKGQSQALFVPSASNGISGSSNSNVGINTSGPRANVCNFDNSLKKLN